MARLNVLCAVGCFLMTGALAFAQDTDKSKDKSEKRSVKTFTSKTGRFSVDMLDKVKESSEDAGKDLKHVKFNASDVGRNFQVSYIDFPKETIEGKKALDLLRRFREGFRKGNKIAQEKELTMGKEKIPGLEYHVDTGKRVFIRERLYLSGTRLYIVFVASVGEKGVITSKEADKFFDSFTITPKE